MCFAACSASSNCKTCPSNPNTCDSCYEGWNLNNGICLSMHTLHV